MDTDSAAKEFPFRIEEYENLQWKADANTDDFVRGITPRNKVLETLKRIDVLPFLNVDLRFSDSTWDFTSINETPVKGHTKFVFNPDSVYCELSKMYVLHELLRKRAKIRSIHSKYLSVSKFLTYAESLGFLQYEFIPQTVYEKYISQLRGSYPRVCAEQGILIMFIRFFEESFGVRIEKGIKQFLMKVDRKRLSAAIEAQKIEEIPKEFLVSIRQVCLTILDSPAEDPDTKITAAALLIIIEIGMRVSEFCGLSTNALHEVYSPKFGYPLFFLRYNIYKIASTDNGKKEHEAYASNIAIKAYNALLELCGPYRKELSKDTLFVTGKMRGQYFSPHSLTIRIKCFFLQHYKELGCLNVGEKYPEVPAYPVYLFFGETGYGKYAESNPLLQELDMDDTISVPRLHQYRVSACTNLIRKGVNIYWAQKYMGHVTPDMTDSYIRAEKEAGRQRAEKVYTALVEDGTKLLGTGADEFMEGFRQYVDGLDINVRKNSDELFRLIGGKYPLRPKLGGVCIRNGEILDCSSSDDTDEIYCAYGMCPFSCHLYFDADVTYGEYLRCKKMIEHNKANGFVKMAQKETNKLRYIVTNRLLPELTELQREVQEKGAEIIKTKYPQIADIVDNFNTIYQEVNTWL